jgi:hypothetical protein
MAEKEVSVRELIDELVNDAGAELLRTRNLLV